MISVKLHKSHRTVVAVCDSNLIGKKFEEGIKQLDVRKTFFQDKTISYKEAVKFMIYQANEDATFNIVGPESIKAAIEAGIIDEKGIGKVQYIPFALVLL